MDVSLQSMHLRIPFIFFSINVLALIVGPRIADAAQLNETAAATIFVYNPKSLEWKAIKNGAVVRTGHGSAGRSYCPDIKRSCRTPSGIYHVLSKGNANCKSSRYPVGKGGAPMPYCMFFSKYYAIHGSSSVPNYNASHGCIRVKPQDARWLNQDFINIGTTVEVGAY